MVGNNNTQFSAFCHVVFQGIVGLKKTNTCILLHPINKTVTENDGRGVHNQQFSDPIGLQYISNSTPTIIGGKNNGAKAPTTRRITMLLHRNC